MKNFKKIFVIFALMLLSVSGILFGCQDKYADLKIETDLQDNAIELFFGNDLTEEQGTEITFTASVLGAGDGVSTDLKYSILGSRVVAVELNKVGSSNKTEVKLSAIDYGEAELVLLTEEGNKSLDINLKVTIPLKGIYKNNQSGYNAYAVSGETTKISTSKFLTFDPQETTQKDVKYTLLSNTAGVVVFEDGRIAVEQDVQNSTILVRATSVSNSDIHLDFNVQILRPIDEILVKLFGQVVENEDTIKFGSMLEENFKILNIVAVPDDNPYTLNFAFASLDGENEVLSPTSDKFQIDQIDSENYGITALKVGTEKLKITASINGYEYVSKPIYLNLLSIETPSVIEVSTSIAGDLYVYDTYQNGLGEPISVSVGSPSAYDRRFVIQIESYDAEKVIIYTGQRDNVGRLVPVKFYKDNAVEGTYDILPNSSILYLVANSEEITADGGEDIVIKFIAYGSMGLLGNQIETNLDIKLRRGVSELTLGHLEEYLLVPIKQNEGDEGTILTINTNANEWTTNIYTNFSNQGLILKERSVAYEDTTNNAGLKQYNFVLFGVREGIYNLRFFSNNGKYVDVKVRVFTKVDAITITTSSIEQNSDIAQIDYKTENDLPTLNGGSLIIRKGGYAELNLNAYLNKNLQNCTFKSINYTYDESIIKINNNNRISGNALGQTNVTVIISVYDNSVKNKSIKEFELNFVVKVETLIKTISLNSKNQTIYTKESLSEYPDENGVTDKQKYGEFTFVLTVNPMETKLDDNSIFWVKSGSDASALLVEQTNYQNGIFKLKVSCENLLGINQKEGFARLTFTVVQYQRTLVVDAVVNIKVAQKVEQIYNVKKVQNNVTTSVPRQNSVLPMVDEGGNDSYDPTEYLYLYFDSRNMQEDTNFTISTQVSPTNVLNKSLAYIVEELEDYRNVLIVANNRVIVNKAGLAILWVCAVDSYDITKGDIIEPRAFSQKVQIVVKVADGLTKYTALDIANASDLRNINNNIQSLQKFYKVTKHITLTSASWTPIGYIDGEMHEFSGSIDGFLANEFGERVYATISGLNLSSAVEYQNDYYVGLIASMAQGSVVQNLNLNINAINILQTNETKSLFVGGLTAKNAGILQNVSVNFVNSGKDVSKDVNIDDSSAKLCFGGIIGQNSGTVVSCFVDGYVNIKNNLRDCSYAIGGLVGENTDQTNYAIDGRKNFFNQKDITTDYNSYINIVVNQLSSTNKVIGVGGVVGVSYAPTKNVSFAGNVKGLNNIGGIIGYLSSNIENTFSSGIITGATNVGGLVGYASNAQITNSSLNVFDKDSVSFSIIGRNNIGGLVGYASNLTLSNAYARSYVGNVNYLGDLLATSQEDDAYIGGVIGKAENSTLQKVYAQLKINASNSVIGGLVGYANNSTITNAYEKNDYLVGEVFGLIVGLNGEQNSTVNYFYSKNDGVFASNIVKLTSNHLKNASNIANIYSDWGSSVITKSKNKSTWGSANWYLPEGEIYPYMIFGEKQILSVEPPTIISLEIKNGLDILKELEVSEDGQYYALFKKSTYSIDFSSLFDVKIEPEDEVLNISTAYNLNSSDSSILEVVGRTSGAYRIKPVSNGKVELTVSSKLNKNVFTKITLFVIDVVKDFSIYADNFNSVVNSQIELKTRMSSNWINNNHFAISFTNLNNNFYINGKNQETNNFENNEKIFVYADKADTYIISYKLFVTLVDGEKTFTIELPNLTNLNVLENISRNLTFRFVYGINNFVGDTKELETGLNDTATITYTLIGDDLRYNVQYDTYGNISHFELPKIKWSFDNNSYKCWDAQLIYANIYTSTDQTEPTKILFTKTNAGAESINDYSYNLNQLPNDTFVKIEYVFRVVINETFVDGNNNLIGAKTYFANHKDAENIKTLFKVEVQIIEDAEIDNYEDRDIVQRDFPAEFIIKRQKIDNIGLDFYTNAEKILNQNNETLYNINEVPSRAIISGEEGILKIHIAPTNAEISVVNVKYSNNNGFNMSIRQMLQYSYYDYIESGNSIEEFNPQKIKYYVKDGNNFVESNDIDYDDTKTYYEYKKVARFIDRKPYAVAIENGKGIQLYTESNFIENGIQTFDGYLYVSCLIPSVVPSGEEFTIYIDAIYTNGYHFVQTIDLVSKLPSKISVSYPFNSQNVNDFAFIARGVKKQIYVDFTELIYETIDDEIESKLNNLNMFLNLDESVKLSLNGFEKATPSIPYLRAKYDIVVDKLSNDNNSYTIQVMFTKIENNVQSVVLSNAFKLQCVPYVITEMNIIDGGTDNTLIVPQSSPKGLQVKLSCDIDEKYDEEGNLISSWTSTELNTLKNQISELESKISVLNISDTESYYWFGMKQSENVYSRLQINDNQNSKDYYSNYKIQRQVIGDTGIISISVKLIDTNAKIYSEVGFRYNSLGASINNIDAEYQIGINRTGLIQKRNGNNYIYVHYLKDDVIVRFISDVSEESPIPIKNQEEFEKMSNGTQENGMVYYALDNDIVLENYRPRNLEYISLNGNMHTIKIAGFDIVGGVENGETTFNQNYGLFDTIDGNSIVKHLNIQYGDYVDTTKIGTARYGNLDGNNNPVGSRIGLAYAISNANSPATIIDGNEYYTNIAGNNWNTESSFPFNLSNTNINSFNFGGLATTNNGIVFNVKVSSLENKPLDFVNNITNSSNIAGMVATNNGYITNSTSTLSIKTNCGFVAGFVSSNNQKISNSKVLLNGAIQNTLTTNTNTLTAGFVAKNAGSIFGCYVSNPDHSVENELTNNKAVVKSNLNVGGFVNENSGTIENSYSNVSVESETRSSGFVFKNENEAQIISCYTTSKIVAKSNAHTPFVGTDTNNEFQNLGTIDDCYYIGIYIGYEEQGDEIATNIPSILESSPSLASRRIYQKFFNKFAFTTWSLDGYDFDGHNYEIDGTWKIDRVPRLIDADLNIYSQEKCLGISTFTNDDGNVESYYNWSFSNENRAFGKSWKKNSIKYYNPRIITDINDWNKVITKELVSSVSNTSYNTLEDCFVIVKDITSTESLSPKTSELDFGGTIFGSNMEFNNIYLMAEADNNSKSYGLFRSIKGKVDAQPSPVFIIYGLTEQRAVVKDLNITAKAVVANNSNCVGALAGYIDTASITNIDVIVEDAVVQGKSMVGAFAGLISNSEIRNVNVSGSVNASYLKAQTSMYNYVSETDFDILTNVDELESEVPYSYAGTFAGGLVNNNLANNINVTGVNKIIAYYAGGLVGLVDKNSCLSNSSVEVTANQYVRAYNIAGGVVAENRGTINYTKIEHSPSVQQNIDNNISNTYVTNRNLTYFAGSPKFIGGLVGFNNGGNIYSSYSKLDVRVTENYITIASGGLVGLDVGGFITICYATGSVTNRYIIGGLIGVVTNKSTLLGSFKKVSGNSFVIERNDENSYFATNYEPEILAEEEVTDFGFYQKVVPNSNKRGAYIAGKIFNEEGEGSDVLYIDNTLASNKWILKPDDYGFTDVNYLENADSGLLVGSIVNNIKMDGILIDEDDESRLSNHIYMNFDHSMLTSEYEFKVLSNYINTQALKGAKANVKNLYVSDVLRSVLYYNNDEGINDAYYNEVDGNKVKSNLLKHINYAAIGSLSNTINISFNKNTRYILAKCTLQNDSSGNATKDSPIISFENILNQDDLILNYDSENDRYKSGGLYYQFDTDFKLPKINGNKNLYPEIIVNINK